ncbi:c-type cytochrome [Hoeflea prorocentri]|uniref:Cytochrome c n=1 Tax=Hoeflea prorocentri TaxID=1922333 RepID=A0A9X3UMC0_9HYPH|nr:cytochrome c [Hoeflea prorocentri]MCY6383363.1 cytochrome c [Hoeflea prorocentri]MDA5401163.1 cytochrome c [Hoeflea prorocentri]
MLDRKKPISAGIIVVLMLGMIAWNVLGGPDHNSDAKAGVPMVQVAVPAIEGQARLGESVFNEHCAVCHGNNAAGQEGIAPPLVHIIYEPSHHSDTSFFLAVRNGVRAHHWRFGDMPAVQGVSEAEIEQIVTYIRTLQRANGIN